MDGKMICANCQAQLDDEAKAIEVSEKDLALRTRIDSLAPGNSWEVIGEDLKRIQVIVEELNTQYRDDGKRFFVIPQGETIFVFRAPAREDYIKL